MLKRMSNVFVLVVAMIVLVTGIVVSINLKHPAVPVTPQPTVTEKQYSDTYVRNITYQLHMYEHITDAYKQLSDLVNGLDTVRDGLELARLNSTSANLRMAKDRWVAVRNQFNANKSEILSSSTGEEVALDTKDMRPMLDKIYNAIDKYDAALINLVQKDMASYNTNMAAAAKESAGCKDAATAKYNTFRDMIFNFNIPAPQ